MPLLKCFEINVICSNSTYSGKHIKFYCLKIVHEKFWQHIIVWHESFHILINSNRHTVNCNRQSMF